MARPLSLLTLTLVLAACAPDVGPVPLMRLFTAGQVWTAANKPAGEPTLVVIAGDGRPALTLPSGTEASVIVNMPVPRPCWFDFEVGVPGARQPAGVTVEVAVDGESLTRRRVQTAPGFETVRLDFAAYQSRRVTLSIRLEAEQGDLVALANPRLEAKEVYDSRHLQQVLVVLPATIFQALSQAPDQYPIFARLGRESVSFPEVQAVEGGFLGGGVCQELGRRFVGADRELHGFAPAVPDPGTVGFDSWTAADPWDPSARDAARRLFLLLGRDRPHPLTLVLHSKADAASVEAGLSRLVERLQSEGDWERSMLVLVAESGSDADTMLVRPPDLSRGFSCVTEPGARAEKTVSLDALPDLLQWTSQRASRQPVSGDDGLGLFAGT